MYKPNIVHCSFINELGNLIKESVCETDEGFVITIEGPNSISENTLTYSEVYVLSRLLNNLGLKEKE